MTKDVILHYISLVGFLGEALGPDYEILLFDVRNNKNEIVAISNGKISGRTIGDPISEYTKERLKNKDHENIDFRTNYKGIVRGNKFIRCSTKYIKDENNELVGILSINFDDSRYEKISSDILKLCHPDAIIGDVLFEKVDENIITDDYENLSYTLTDTATELINNTFKKLEKPIEKLNTKEKKSIVEFLNSKDIFLLKNTISIVADKLDISEATLYRYVADIEKKID